MSEAKAMAALRPLRSEAIVALESTRGTSRSGIVLTTKDGHQDNRGELVAMSAKALAKLGPEGVQVGDHVVFERSAGERIPDPTPQGRRLVRLKWSDIQGVVE